MTVFADHSSAGLKAAADTSEAPEPVPPRRGVLFWIRRYLPPEIVGTTLMLLAGLAVTTWTAAPAAVAVAAVIGETIGFYAVLAVSIMLEQSRVVRSRRRAAIRTLLLLVAEFGAAELLDTFLVRPAALVLALLWLPDPVWALLVGKVVADLIFYAVAAGAFTITAKTGVRSPRPTEEPS